MKIKEKIDGILLALQFYTTVPVQKQVPLDKRRLKNALYVVPLIGILIGLLLVAILTMNERVLDLPHSIIALLVVTIPILVTGGLHIDGWMDASDAYFSYRDKQKRLDIMDDPRTGSFAVLSVIFLLAWRYIFIFETLKFTTLTTLLILLVSVYYFARISMCFVFIFGKLAKQDGMAAFFKKGLERNDVYFHIIGVVIFLICIAWIDLSAVRAVFILFIVAVGFAIVSKAFIERQFGGISGDTLGATLEGGETILWFTVWFLHLFGMGLL